MELLLLAARVVLAAVFGAAACTKLVDPTGTQQAIIAFGVPARLARPLRVFLPLAELAIALALIPITTAWYGALGALALLALFSLAIGINLARGKTPDCHCFGQLHSEPVGWRTLARNGVLIAIAGIILGAGRNDPGLSAVAWLENLSMAAGLGLLAATLGLALIAGEGWLILNLLRQNGRILTRLDHLEGLLLPGAEPARPAQTQPQRGLPVGTPAPAFSLAGLYGETLTLDALRANGKPVLLLFSDPGCGPCNALLPEIGTWQREHADRLTLAVISRGAVNANRAKSAEHGITTTLLQQEREVAETYKASGTPSAVVVNSDGTIASPVAVGPDAIRQLMRRTVGVSSRPLPLVAPSNGHSGPENGQTARPHPSPVPQVGQAAPDISLPDLDGNPVELASYRGRETLVLFWNPGCGYCRRMLDDLRAWEADRPQDAPSLLVVSTGSAETNREMGLVSTIVLDQGFSAGRAFGASGTPSAILVDAQGRIASQVSVGGPAVLELAGAPST